MGKLRGRGSRVKELMSFFRESFRLAGREDGNVVGGAGGHAGKGDAKGYGRYGRYMSDG